MVGGMFGAMFAGMFMGMIVPMLYRSPNVWLGSDVANLGLSSTREGSESIGDRHPQDEASHGPWFTKAL